MELTEACIARAEALEPRLNAYITRTFDTARQEARAAEAEIAAGRRKGPLHGVPFAIKDLYETAGVVTTAGSALREHYVPAEDAETVRRLKNAGIVMLGKLSLHEWAMGGTNVQSYYPTPRNAWDTSRITGGSSGGSGTALAAGYCYGSLGSDTRGSIRIPASLCGVSGIKATYGRVSLRGVVPLSWSLDHAGPMARTAYDCALILNTIAGYDPHDPTCADLPVEDYTTAIEAALTGVRIGVPRNWFFDEGFTEPEITRIVQASRDVFASLGAVVSDVDFPGPLDWDASAAFGAEAASYHKDNVAAHPDKYSDPTRTAHRAVAVDNRHGLRTRALAATGAAAGPARAVSQRRPHPDTDVADPAHGHRGRAGVAAVRQPPGAQHEPVQRSPRADGQRDLRLRFAGPARRPLAGRALVGRGAGAARGARLPASDGLAHEAPPL